MNTPSLAVQKFVESNGHLTAGGLSLMSQLLDTFSKLVSNEGLNVPQQTSANITQLNTAQSVGKLLYDTDTNELKVNIGGTYKVVQVT